MARLISIGDNTVDVYLDQSLYYPGGNAVNVAVMAARLGQFSAYLGCFGDDESGATLLTSLKDEGVDISHCRTLPQPNGWACVSLLNGDRRFLGSDPGACQQLQLSVADFEWLHNFTLAHITAYSKLETSLPVLRYTMRWLSFDFSDDWTLDKLTSVGAYIDIAFLSCADMDDEQTEQILRHLLRSGVQVAVATRGARSVMAMDKHGRRHMQEIMPITVVDTLGAGDGFIAGFLVAWLSVSGLIESLKAGVEYASIVCGYKGGFGYAQPLYPSLRARIEKVVGNESETRKF